MVKLVHTAKMIEELILIRQKGDLTIKPYRFREKHQKQKWVT